MGALVERLCQVEEDESRNIALNPFCEGLFSVLGGYHTIAEIKAFYDMTTEDEDELDTLIARITAYADDYHRDRAVHRVRSILTFWEQSDVPGYQTVALVRSHLNAI